uniref:Carboxylesterase type B domain-containing protein n=1 Tax=Timema monikensis TaxID=170555 RepID=A0A7R9EHD6_9NEOP|nr:unnamed protein product [Timema monikensis]
MGGSYEPAALTQHTTVVQDPSVIEAAVHEYRPWPDSNASFRDQFLHFCGALYTRVKSEQLARWLARRGTTVWRYEFSYRPQCSPHPRFMGPAHGDEVLFVFGLLEEEATGQETQLEQRVLTSWTNFAKTGDPNMNSTLVWKQFTDGAKHMMVFSVPQNSMKMTDFLSRDLDFWNLMVPGLLRHTQRALLHGRATGREHGSQPSTCPSGTSVGLLIMSLVLSTALLLISYYLCHSVRNSNKGLLTQDHTAQH